MNARPRRQTKPALDPYSTAPRDALELMARMLVSGAYRVPVVGRGTRSGLSQADIAAACGMMRSPVEREIALLVAMRAEKAALAHAVDRVYSRCARAVKLMRPAGVLDLTKPADRWRLRMIVFDAGMELVHPNRRRPYRLLAMDAKMRKSDYMRLHKTVTAELQEMVANARLEFAGRLWGIASGGI